MLAEVLSLLSAREPPQGLELFCDYCITVSLFEGLETLLETDNIRLERLLPLQRKHLSQVSQGGICLYFLKLYCEPCYCGIVMGFLKSNDIISGFELITAS